MLAVAGLWIASYAMWILIPKSLGFFYYYYLPSIFLALPLAGDREALTKAARRAGALRLVLDLRDCVSRCYRALLFLRREVSTPQGGGAFVVLLGK